jgi:glutathione S-transferase
VLEFLILLCENYALYLKDFGVSQVREIVSILDIDALFYPCPKNGPTFRPKAIEMGGKKQFPYMVDPNTGTAMYESDNIIKYLVDKYG